MQIHELKLSPRKDRKRVGRGGRRGTYSGRGIKGQKARSGASVDPLFEGGRSSLVERLKKLRGFKSQFNKKLNLVLADIDEKFKAGETVGIKSLVEAGLIKKTEAYRGVKIIGGGEIKKAIKFESDILLSASTLEAVKKAGGEILVKVEKPAEKAEKAPERKGRAKAKK